jgi:TatD DNase family protein
MYLNIHTHTYQNNAQNLCILNVILKKSGATEYPNKPFSVGLHPWYLDWYAHGQPLQDIFPVNNPNFIAIGECGLDWHCKTPRDLQYDLFKQQIQLAKTLKKPLIIHCVKAHNDLISVLKKEKWNNPTLIHGFNNNIKLLKDYLKANFFVSLGAALLNPGSNAHKLIREIPLNKLFFETDAINDVAIERIYQKASEVLNLPVNILIDQTKENYTRFIG